MTRYSISRESTVTLGSTDIQSWIESDIDIAGAEKTPTEHTAQDGTAYSIPGLATSVTVTFDYRQGEGFDIEDLVYGPETTNGSPVEHTVNFAGAGVAKNLTLNNVSSEDGGIWNVTLTNLKGISTPTKQIKGDIVMKTLTATVGASSVTEVFTEET